MDSPCWSIRLMGRLFCTIAVASAIRPWVVASSRGAVGTRRQSHRDRFFESRRSGPLRRFARPPRPVFDRGSSDRAGFAGMDNPMATQLLDQLAARGVPVRPLTAPQSWDVAGVRFTVSHPVEGWHPETSDNARSLVLDVAYRGRHLLLTGDLERQGLDELVDRPPPQPSPDIFLAPHHGGRTANPEWLYEWAKPRLVVVSQRRERLTRPTPSLPSRGSGSRSCATWRHGSIHFTWMDDGIMTRTFLDNSHDAPGGPPLETTTAAEFSPKIARVTGRSSSRMRFLIGCAWICARGIHVSGHRGDRVRGVGVDRSAPVDFFRPFSSRGPSQDSAGISRCTHRGSGVRRSPPRRPLARRPGTARHGEDCDPSSRFC